MNTLLLDKHTIKQAAEPQSVNGAAVTGARIGLGQGHKLAVLVQMGDSTGAVVAFTLKQHTAASGGSSKDLEVANKYFKKVGAATKFTKVEPTAAAATYTLSSDFAAEPGTVVFEVEGNDLDVNGGYTHFSINMADTTAAKVVSMSYILKDVKYAPAYSLDV